MSSTTGTPAPTDLVIVDLPDIPTRDLNTVGAYNCLCVIGLQATGSVVALRPAAPADAAPAHPVALAA